MDVKKVIEAIQLNKKLNGLKVYSILTQKVNFLLGCYIPLFDLIFLFGNPDRKLLRYVLAHEVRHARQYRMLGLLRYTYRMIFHRSKMEKLARDGSIESLMEYEA